MKIEQYGLNRIITRGRDFIPCIAWVDAFVMCFLYIFLRAYTIKNIGTQIKACKSYFFGDRSIRRTVHSNDLLKLFWGLRCTARRKLEIYNL